MPTSQEEQEERKRVTLQDADLRRQQQQQEQSQRDPTGTFFSHTHADEISGGGRFAAVNPATVVGAQPLPTYPQLPSSSPWSGSDPVPDEPPLGFRIDVMPEQESSMAMWSSSIEATGPAPADAPSLSNSASLGDAQRAGAGPSSSQTETRLGGPAAVSFASRPDTFIPNVNAGPLSNKDDDNG
jgi:hypothetical protein